MALVDYTTVMILNGAYVLDEEYKVAGIWVSAYKDRIIFDGLDFFEWIEEHSDRIKNYNEIITDDDEDEEGTQHKLAYVFTKDKWIFVVFPDATALGEASYLYAFSEESKDLFFMVAGYGHDRNPLCHFIKRGLSKKTEGELVSCYWRDTVLSVIDFSELLGYYLYEDPLIEHFKDVLRSLEEDYRRNL